MQPVWRAAPRLRAVPQRPSSSNVPLSRFWQRLVTLGSGRRRCSFNILIQLLKLGWFTILKYCETYSRRRRRRMSYRNRVPTSISVHYTAVLAAERRKTPTNILPRWQLELARFFTGTLIGTCGFIPNFLTKRKFSFPFFSALFSGASMSPSCMVGRY